MCAADQFEYKLLGFHLGARFSWGSPIDGRQDAGKNLKVKYNLKADYAFLPFHLHADKREKV